MMLFERIVLATDGSNNSTSAVTEALRIGKASDSQVFVVSVIDSRALSSVSPEIQVAGSIDRMQAEAERIVNEVKMSGEGQNVRTSILYGDPVNEIIKFSQSMNADLIVVGTRGKSGIERLFLGSVAEGVVREAPCPVLVVKNNDQA
jgi:nucleotide-binding universal stress UspA family protein